MSCEGVMSPTGLLGGSEHDSIFPLDGEFDRGDNKAPSFNRLKCSLNFVACPRMVHGP